MKIQVELEVRLYAKAVGSPLNQIHVGFSVRDDKTESTYRFVKCWEFIKPPSTKREYSQLSEAHSEPSSLERALDEHNRRATKADKVRVDRSSHALIFDAQDFAGDALLAEISKSLEKLLEKAVSLGVLKARDASGIPVAQGLMAKNLVQEIARSARSMVAPGYVASKIHEAMAAQRSDLLRAIGFDEERSKQQHEELCGSW